MLFLTKQRVQSPPTGPSWRGEGGGRGWCFWQNTLFAVAANRAKLAGKRGLFLTKQRVQSPPSGLGGGLQVVWGLSQCCLRVR